MGLKNFLFNVIYDMRIIALLYMVFSILIIIVGLIEYYLGQVTLDNLIISYVLSFLAIVLSVVSLMIMQYILAKQDKRSKEYPNFYRPINVHLLPYFVVYGFIIILISLSAIILFFVLLKYPNLNYLNVLYILIGTILVSVLDKLLNKKSEDDKSKKVQRRIISVSRDSIKINIGIAKENLFMLNKPHFMGRFKLLDTYFWDLINSNITEIDLEPKILQDLLLIKHNVKKINYQIIHTNPSDLTPVLIDQFRKKIENLITISESLLQRF